MGFLKKLFKGSSPETEHFQYAEGEKTVDSVVAYFAADTTVNGVMHPAETMMMISWSTMGRLCFEVFGAKDTFYYFYAPEHKPTINDKGLGNTEVISIEGVPEQAHLVEIVPSDGVGYTVSVPESFASGLLSF